MSRFPAMRALGLELFRTLLSLGGVSRLLVPTLTLATVLFELLALTTAFPLLKAFLAFLVLTVLVPLLCSLIVVEWAFTNGGELRSISRARMQLSMLRVELQVIHNEVDRLDVLRE